MKTPMCIRPTRAVTGGVGGSPHRVGGKEGSPRAGTILGASELLGGGRTGQTTPLQGPLPPCAPPTLCTPLLTLIRSGIVEEVEDGDQDVQHVAALQHKEEEFLGEGGGSRQAGSEGGAAPSPLSPSGRLPRHCPPLARPEQPLRRRADPCPPLAHLVEVAELPEEDQQLLVELDLLGGVGQVGLEQGVGQQPGYALEDELEVLGGSAGACLVRLPTKASPSPRARPHPRARGAQIPTASIAVLGEPRKPEAESKAGRRGPSLPQEGRSQSTRCPPGCAVPSLSPHKAREQRQARGSCRGQGFGVTSDT